MYQSFRQLPAISGGIEEVGAQPDSVLTPLTIKSSFEGSRRNLDIFQGQDKCFHFYQSLTSSVWTINISNAYMQKTAQTFGKGK
jgi:hypothetical protein